METDRSSRAIACDRPMRATHDASRNVIGVGGEDFQRATLTNRDWEYRGGWQVGRASM